MEKRRFRTFSVRFPEAVYRKLGTVSRRERRRIGPQIVLIIEQHLAELEREVSEKRDR